MIAASNLAHKHIAIAMPLYNEADGITETLRELDDVFQLCGALVTLYLQDDVSTDTTLSILNELEPQLKMSLSVATNQKNSGHGPTTFNAYLRCLENKPQVVLQLDSDGQFDSSELPALCSLVVAGAEVAIGVRCHRVDPWFRNILTRILRIFLATRFRGTFPDPNSPIRAYRPAALSEMLHSMPSSPLIPNVYLSVLALVDKRDISYLNLSHRSRRGTAQTGTMWASRSSFGRIWRLFKFCCQAFSQLRSFTPRRVAK